jgi:hypothetical protein
MIFCLSVFNPQILAFLGEGGVARRSRVTEGVGAKRHEKKLAPPRLLPSRLRRATFLGEEGSDSGEETICFF